MHGQLDMDIVDIDWAHAGSGERQVPSNLLLEAGLIMESHGCGKRVEMILSLGLEAGRWRLLDLGSKPVAVGYKLNAGGCRG